jgi:cytochrome c oxidase subunit IV
MAVSNPVEQHRQPNYLAIFVSLVVLTAIEIGVTYTPLPRIPVLVPLALAKAALVVLFYMHLRFDRRVFALIFVIGVLMGISLIMAFIALFAPPLLDLPR